MSANIRIVLEAEDKLSPALKESLSELQKIDKEIKEVDSTLIKLQTNKKGVVSGAIESDIADVKKLQAELKKLEAELKSVNRVRAKSDVNKDISKQKILIEREYTKEINRQKAALKSLNNTKSKAIVKTNKQLNVEKKHAAEIKKTTSARNSATNSLVRHIRQLESAAVAFYATQQAMKVTVGLGVELNRQYEDQKMGLAALLAAKTSDVTSTGRQVDAAEKFIIAQKQTAELLNEIKIAATETPASFAQMTGFFQQAIGHALAGGKAFGENVDEINTNVIQLTKRMSNLGAAVGMEMPLINEEIRSLMSGNVSRESLLSLMLFGTPKQANEAIKEAKTRTNGLTILMEKMLAPFSALEGVDTYTKNLAKLKAAYDDIARDSTIDIFEDIKDAMKNTTTFLVKYKDAIVKTFKDIYNYVSFFSGTVVKAITGVGNALNALTDVIASNETRLGLWKGALDSIAIGFNLIGDMANNTTILIKTVVLILEKLFTNVGAKFTAAMMNVTTGAMKTYIDFLKWIKKEFNLSFFDDEIASSEKSLKKHIERRKELIKNSGIKTDEDRINAEMDALAKGIVTINESINASVKAIIVTENQTKADIKAAVALKEKLKLREQAFKDGKLITEAWAEAGKNDAEYQLDEIIKKYVTLEELMTRLNIDGEIRNDITTHYNKLTTEQYSKTTEGKTIEEFEKRYIDSKSNDKDYQLEKLQEDYDRYAEFIDDKIKLDELYAAEKDKIEKKSDKGAEERLKNIENAVNGVYKNLENTLVDFVMKGKFEMSKMVDAIIQDMARIVIQQQITKPLTTATMSYFGSAQGNIISNGSIIPVQAFAQGGVVNNISSHRMNAMSNINKYASGGVVTSPTLFPMSTGTGLMGEAGPEAIMPLTRIDGELGVKSKPANVIIQISNETGLPMDLKEIGQSQNSDGDKIISTILHHMNYDPDFRAVMKG